MEIIAERTLELERPGDPDTKTIRVVIGKPERRDGDVCVASYEIHGPGAGEVVKRELHGVDSMQALESALHVLPIELGAYERRGRLTLDGQVGSGFRASQEGERRDE
jgi:hypothetical protein